MQNEQIIWNQMTMGVAYYPEHGDRSLWRNDLERMLEAGISVVRIAEFAWNIIEPEEGVFTYVFFDEFLDLCQEMGMKVIFCTPSATPPAWMQEKYPEILNSDENGILYRHGGRRNYNYNSKLYQMFVTRMVENEGAHYANNELINALPEFHSESDTFAFRVWLKEKYGTIRALNHAWGTNFWNQTYNEWDEIFCPRKTIVNGKNPHTYLDYYRFVSDSAIAFCKMQADILRIYLKDGDYITTNGRFPNLDNHKMTREALDVYTFDSYPDFAQSLHDSFRKPLNDRAWTRMLTEIRSISPHFGVMEQQSGAGGWVSRVPQPNPRPGQLKLWAMQSVASGADFISFFRWRTCSYGTEIYWYGILDHDNRDNRKLKEVKDFYQDFRKLDPLCGAENRAAFALLRDYDNHWDTNTDLLHGAVSEKSEEEIFIASEVNHTPYDMLFLQPDTNVEKLSKYPVVIYPHPSLINKERVKLLEQYVKKGGILVLGCRSGHKDMDGHCVMMPQPGLLRDLTGTDIQESTFPSPLEEDVYAMIGDEKMETPVFNDVLIPLEGTRVLATYANSYFAGEGALTEHLYGKGKVLHLGSAFSRNNTKQIFDYLGITEPFADMIEAPSDVQVILREKEGRKYLFVLNYMPEERTIVLKNKMRSVFCDVMAEGEIKLEKYKAEVYEVIAWSE